MINVYIDPFSNVFLNNGLFYDKAQDRDDCLSAWRYLKDYCLERNINLNTIDFWNEEKATDEDVYVSLNHKKRIIITKIYSQLTNKIYVKIPKLDKFKNKILFQAEPPVVTPHAYKNIDRLFKIYDEVFFSCILNNSKCRYYNFPQTHDSILFNYWENSNRDFLVMINSNKKPCSRHNELYSERIKAMAFFSRTNEIDLYGFGWNKLPFFPYWFYKSALRRAYKGSVESKYQTLSKYNFAICFENTILPGHVTEKIFDCFFVGTIPVYWGAPDIEKYVPKECFIDMRNFKDYGELRAFLKSLTKSEIESYKEKAQKYLSSEQYKPFTKKYFAEMFVAAIKGENIEKTK